MTSSREELLRASAIPSFQGRARFPDFLLAQTAAIRFNRRKTRIPGLMAGFAGGSKIMRCFRLRFACIAICVALLPAGAVSLFAAETQKSGSALILATHADAAPLRSDATAPLLKTFNEPAVDTSLNKPAIINAKRSAFETGALDDVQAVSVPEPTALFLAGFAGCMLLAVVQRLRGSGQAAR